MGGGALHPTGGAAWFHLPLGGAASVPPPPWASAAVPLSVEMKWNERRVTHFSFSKGKRI